MGPSVPQGWNPWTIVADGQDIFVAAVAVAAAIAVAIVNDPSAVVVAEDVVAAVAAAAVVRAAEGQLHNRTVCFSTALVSRNILPQRKNYFS